MNDDTLIRLVTKVSFYARMSASVDSNNTEATAMSDKARGLVGKTSAAIAFMDPELLAIGQDTLEQWLDEEPRLAFLRHQARRHQRHLPPVGIDKQLLMAVLRRRGWLAVRFSGSGCLNGGRS